MSQRHLHRALSLCLAAVFTFAMLASVDQLARVDEGAPQWAQQATPRA